MSDYTINYTMYRRSEWRVGYSMEADQLFVFYIDEDDIFWAWSNFGLNSGLYETLVDNSYVDLGEL